MNVRLIAGFCCLLLLLGLVQVPLLAAEDPMTSERDLARVRKKVEALRAWQLTEVLDLDEKMSSKLFPAIREADEGRWRVEARNRELVRDMSRLVGIPGTDPGKISRILDELQANRMELARIEERHIQRVRQILSPEDTARYIMFQIRFQREIKRRAAEALREHRQSEDDRGLYQRDRYDNMDRDNGETRGDDSGGSGGGDSGGSGGSGGGSGGGRR